jgi:hypothetical protein
VTRHLWIVEERQRTGEWVPICIAHEHRYSALNYIDGCVKNAGSVRKDMRVKKYNRQERRSPRAKATGK